MTKEMNKRITSLFLAFTMLLQIFLPQNIFAEGDKSLPQDKYVKVGMIDGKSYDAKIMNELNRIAAKNRKSSPGKPGVRLFSSGPYFGDNNEPKDEDKPKYFGNVSAKLDLKGLDGNDFQWNEIFGVDESGNPKPAQIIFRQMDAESSTDTGLYYMLQITKEGKYTWSDGEGKPTKLPLFSKSLKPYRYEVRIDERVSDKVKLLTEVIFGTEGSSPTFSPENADGEIIANITLGLTYQQIASTKFKSEWHTDVVETDRPGMKANFAFDDEGDGVSPVSVELPKNDKDTKIIRDWYNEFEPDLVISYYLEKTPEVTIDDTTDGLTFEENGGVKTVTSGDHKYKYDFTYDVINGGKLTMTEILPVTFDANGGKFDSIADPNAEQKIKSEVDYEKDVTVPEAPTKEGETFIGWGEEANATTSVAADAFKGIKEAKTFYAIFTKDIIEQKDNKKPDDVPAGHVKVTVDVTDKAKLGEGDKQTRIFWVDPKKEVTLPVTKPTGKDVPVDGTNPKAYTWVFTNWTSDEAAPRTWSDGITATFPKETTITANYGQNISDQGTVVAKEITVHESFKKSETEWVNNFIDSEATEAKLKEAIKVKDASGADKNLPADATVTFLDDSGNPIADDALKNALYDKLQEKDNPDDKPTRVEKVKAKVTFENDEVQMVDIPIKVLKNIYEAKTLTEKPFYVPDGYVKVTLDPTNKAQDPQKTYYYVNKDAQVVIPGKNPVGTSGHNFINWTIPGTPDPVEYSLADRHQFSGETTITAQYVGNVVEQKGEDKPKVPDDFVQVIVDTTDQATEASKFTRTFWVKKNTPVRINVKDPVYKDSREAFAGWKDKSTDETVNLDQENTFTKDVTEIEAFYGTLAIPQLGKDKPGNVPKNFIRVFFDTTDKAKVEKRYTWWVAPNNPSVKLTLDTPVGKDVKDGDGVFLYKWKFYEWENKERGLKCNDPKKRTYELDTNKIKDGDVFEAEYELDFVIPYDPAAPFARPEGYARVTFEAENGLKLEKPKAYYVKKNAGVKLNDKSIKKPDVTVETGYKFEKWDKEDTLVIREDIVVTAKATKLDNVIPEKDKNGNDNTKPEGYKEVTFVVKTGDEGKGSIEGVTKFYVNPTEYVTINPPTTKANTGYEFGTWDKNASIPTVYKEDTKITGSFNGLKDVIPKTNPDGTENKKPDGYKTVTFVIDPATGGKIADKEITVYYVNPAKEVTVPQPKTNADTGYVFEKWDQDTTTAKKYTGDTTVKGNFKKLEDIIPAEENGTTNAKPDGYITVTFEKGEHGTKIEGQTVYYVNPTAGKTLAAITKPTVTPDTGWKQKAAPDAWDTKDDFEIKADKTVKAKYEELKAVIPQGKEDGTDKPDGYITVTFEKGEHGKELTGQAVYYVNPNKAVALEDKAPKVTPNTGYDFAGWDTQIEKKIQYSDGDIIKALYNEKGDVIPQENPNGTDKPAGYLTVTFDKGKHGELSGKTVYYVKPNKEVTVPAPTVKPETGWKQKDGSEAWNASLTQTFTAQNTTITAQYEGLADVVPGDQAKPDGYVTVTFKAVNGSLSGTTTYYVNPKVSVDLTKAANGLSKTPNVGYKGTGSWNPVNLSGTFTADTTFTFTFDKLDDVIPATEGQTRPDGYVTVKFIAGLNGSLEGGDKTYYVNPNAKVKIGGTDIPVPAPTPKTDYDFKEWIDAVDKTNPIIDNQTHVAQFVYKPDTVTLTYEAKDATSGEVPGMQTVKKGNAVILAGAKTLTKDNATLWGWEIDGTKYPVGASVTLNDNTTATAVWTTNSHTVEFNTMGGSYIPSQKVAHGSKIEPVNPPTKPGHTFTGWTLNGNAFDPAKDTITGDSILVANYVPNVIPETGNGKPDNVPKNFVPVTVDPTDKATDSTKQVFWVKPNETVQIPAKHPTGRQVGDTTYVFDSWNPSLIGKFSGPTTIEAQYKKQTPLTPIFDPRITTGVVATDLNKQPPLEAYRDQIKSESHKEFDLVKIVEQPKVNESGFTSAKIKISFKENGMTQVVDVLVYVKPGPVIIEKPYPVPGDCNNSCDQPNQPNKPGEPNKPNKPNQPNIGMDALNTTDHYQYLIGYPDGNFAPNRGMTRAEVATMFTRLLKERPVKGQRYYTGFSDIQAGDWYANTVGYAVQVGIVSGYPDGSFKPNKPITRAEFAAIASRFDALAQGNNIAFSDLAPSHWGYNAIRSAASKGWITGYPDDTFRPEKAITRAEVTSITNRMLNRYADLYWIDGHRAEVIRFGDVKRSDWYFEPIMEATMGHDFIRDRDGKTEHWSGLNGKSFI